MNITETPEFFKILEGKDLEGKICSSCYEPFDIDDLDAHGYQSKVDYYRLRKEEIYHIECLRNFILPLVNSVG